MRTLQQRWRANGVVVSVWLALQGCSNAAPVASAVPSGVIPAKLAVTDRGGRRG